MQDTTKSVTSLFTMDESEYNQFVNPERGHKTYVKRGRRDASKGLKGRHSNAVRVIPRKDTVDFKGNTRKPYDVKVKASVLDTIL